MPFSVRIINRDGSPAAPGTVRTLSRPRVTIGRAPDCDLVLDDPKRYVSRVHAIIARADGGYALTVASKVNFVLVNGQRHGPNSTATVRPGDHLEIGRYQLEVLTSPEAVVHGETVSLDSRGLQPAPGKPSAPLQHSAAPARGPGAAAPRAPAGAKSLIASLAGDDDIEASRGVPPGRASARDRSGLKLLQAFMTGAGLPHDNVHEEEGERYMQSCGALLRASIEGIISLLMARAEMKKEIRAEDRTMVSSRDNNPLKLMTDPQEALSFIFDQHAPEGVFLPPVDAVKDACDELRAHEIALMAAMRAAIMGVIERFNPERLEEVLEKTRGTVRLNRKGALWDLFVEYHAKLSHEAEDDFNRAFAKEFLGTYTTQVQRLRGKR